MQDGPAYNQCDITNQENYKQSSVWALWRQSPRHG